MKLTLELEREIGTLPACKDCLAAKDKFFDPEHRKYALACAPESKEWDPCGECLQIVVDFIIKKHESSESRKS
jgi:cytidine deaminase